MNNLLVLPILIPLFTAAISLLFWRRRREQRLLSVLGSALHLGAAAGLLWQVQQNGIQVIPGSCPNQFLNPDPFHGFMPKLWGLLGFMPAPK